MGQMRVTPANRRAAPPLDTVKRAGGIPTALLQAMQAAATGIVAPTGWGKRFTRNKSEPFKGKIRIARDSSPKKRMRAMQRGVPCP